MEANGCCPDLVIPSSMVCEDTNHQCDPLGPGNTCGNCTGGRQEADFPFSQPGSGRRGWSSTTPTSPLPLLNRAAQRQQHQLPRMCRAKRDQINHLQNLAVHELFKSQILQMGNSHFSQLSAPSRRKSKWSPLSLQAYFLQLFEFSVPQVISSHMCHFSFTMLNRALIKRFSVSSWIFFRKKKITQLQEAAVTLQKDMQATEGLTWITISKRLE